MFSVDTVKNIQSNCCLINIWWPLHYKPNNGFILNFPCFFSFLFTFFPPAMSSLNSAPPPQPWSHPPLDTVSSSHACFPLPHTSSRLQSLYYSSGKKVSFAYIHRFFPVKFLCYYQTSCICNYYLHIPLTFKLRGNSFSRVLVSMHKNSTGFKPT